MGKISFGGFTLIEFSITVLMLAIILLAVIPSWIEFINKRKLAAAAESIYDTLKIAHSESTKLNSNITVAFTAGSNWCAAINDNGDCNCNTGVCTIGGVSHIINGANYQGISLAITNLTNNKFVTFDGMRGVASASGSITVSNPPHSIVIKVSKIGSLSMCSDSMVGYGVCL